MDKKAFYELCQNQFHFLFEEYGFRCESRKSSSLIREVLFQNKTTAVSICFDIRDQDIDVHLGRLVDGVFDRWSIGNCYNIWFLAVLREPTWRIPMIKPTEERIVQNITAQAQFVKKHARDILNGDFSIFDDLHRIADPRAWYDLSVIDYDKGIKAFESGDYQSALSNLQRSFALHATCKTGFYIAKAHAALGRDEEAFRAMQAAHTCNHCNPLVATAYAEMLADRGNLQKAFELLDVVIDRKAYEPAIQLKAELLKNAT
ncbi:MAG: hypothetical protein ABFD54_18110 [Armatimonadota bacterium]|nr:hypothetical protein [bacterium]